jgi:phosphatidylserine synthase
MMMSQALAGGAGERAESTTPMEHVLALIPEALRMSLCTGLQYLTFLLLPALALLMVSKVPYTHAFSKLMSARGRWAMVRLVLLLLFLALAPVLTLFILGWVYLFTGLFPFLRQWRNGTLDGNEAA